jgi:hypothetical protein
MDGDTGMTDDLVERLRNPTYYTHPTTEDGKLAADRIEALTAERDKYEAAWMTAEGKLADAEAGRDRLREMVQASVNFMNGDLTVSEWNEVCMRPWQPPALKGAEP